MKKSHQNEKKNHLSFKMKYNIRLYFKPIFHWRCLGFLGSTGRGRGCVLPVFYGGLWFSEQLLKPAGRNLLEDAQQQEIMCLYWHAWSFGASETAALLLDLMEALGTERILPAFVCTLLFLVSVSRGSVGWGMQDRMVSWGLWGRGHAQCHGSRQNAQVGNGQCHWEATATVLDGL